MHKLFLLTALSSVLATTQLVAETLSSSLGIFTYPAQGQSEAQMSKDDYECFSWAKDQSGYDPMSPPEPVAQPANNGPSGARLRGAARGAAGGAIIGEIADDDAGKGAAIGATLGTMRAGRDQRQAQQQQAAAADQAALQDAEQLSAGFKSAYSACMDARGYSVQ